MTTKLIVRKRCPKCHEGEMEVVSGYIRNNNTEWRHICNSCDSKQDYLKKFPREEIKYDAVAEIWED